MVLKMHRGAVPGVAALTAHWIKDCSHTWQSPLVRIQSVAGGLSPGTAAKQSCRAQLLVHMVFRRWSMSRPGTRS